MSLRYKLLGIVCSLEDLVDQVMKRDENPVNLRTEPVWVDDIYCTGYNLFLETPKRNIRLGTFYTGTFPVSYGALGTGANFAELKALRHASYVLELMRAEGFEPTINGSPPDEYLTERASKIREANAVWKDLTKDLEMTYPPQKNKTLDNVVKIGKEIITYDPWIQLVKEVLYLGGYGPSFYLGLGFGALGKYYDDPVLSSAPLILDALSWGAGGRFNPDQWLAYGLGVSINYIPELMLKFS